MPTSAPVLRRALKARAPSLTVERTLWADGHEVVVGVDEVGRGAWAGPISVGAAVLPRDRRVYKVRDSKMLTEAEREALFDRIAAWCSAWAVGHASQSECDELGMAAAQRLAARRAVTGLGVVPDQVLIDGNWDFVGGGNTQRLVKGDARCLSIAAASILAKVTRDRIMRAEAEHFPGYDFERNKGYPCPHHKVALTGMGPTSIHRRSWVFMDHLPWSGLRRALPAGFAGGSSGIRTGMSDADRPTNDERLDELDDKIEAARREAEAADIIEDPDEPRFHQTGERSDIDDQTIVPPG
jgi:ribonuclease HII